MITAISSAESVKDITLHAKHDHPTVTCLTGLEEDLLEKLFTRRN